MLKLVNNVMHWIEADVLSNLNHIFEALWVFGSWGERQFNFSGMGSSGNGFRGAGKQAQYSL